MQKQTKNLGSTVAWYAEDYDNSYGPKDVLENLNILTEDWDNVDPIKSYIYINNLNGTEKPNGYQKIEIKDGKTTLTHKDGTIITEVSGISKARLLTLEEVFEIAAKTNENLKEENLRLFIERNLPTLNAKLGTSLETVYEIIEYVVNNNDNLSENELDQAKAHWVVIYVQNAQSIETTYDILLPEYIHQNLHSSLPFGVSSSNFSA